MKNIILILYAITFTSIVWAQIPLAEIEGRLDIHAPDDPTSIHIGKFAGIHQDSSGLMYNTYFGNNAGNMGTTGNKNSFYGYNSGRSNMVGDQNCFFGSFAGEFIKQGNQSVGIGFQALFGAPGPGATTIISNTVAVGYQAGYDGGNSSLFLGHSAGKNADSINNRLYIANHAGNSPLIYGEFDNDLVRINGDLQTEDGSIFMRNLGSINTDQGIKWGEGADSHIFGLVYDGNGDGASSKLYLREYNGTDTDVMTFKADGKIGIGTTDPKFKTVIKHINNAIINDTLVDISDLALVLEKDSNTNNQAIGIGFQSSTTATNIGGAIIFERSGETSKGHLHFATKSSETDNVDIPIRMTIEDHGNVGIGITDPEAPLHINDFMKLEPTDTAPTCTTATDAGKIYYHMTDNKLRVCTKKSPDFGWVDLH